MSFITQPDTTLIDNNVQFKRSHDDVLNVDWSIGNTCNYACTYCNDFCYDGSDPWPEVDDAILLVEKIIEHYGKNGLGKTILWNILGGEPTVWKDFEKFFKALKQIDPSGLVRIQTNGSRSLAWWERNAQYVDDVIISYHSESADYKHIAEVSRIIHQANRKKCNIQICLYPPLMDKAIAASEYLSKYAYADSLHAKVLKKTLSDTETFVYDEKDLNKIHQFVSFGQPSTLVKDDVIKINEKFFYTTYFVDADGNNSNQMDEYYLMSNGLNTWKDWHCYIGIDTLSISSEGNIRASSGCDRKNIICNWIDDGVENINWPSQPIICRWDFCSCGNDISAKKVKYK